MRFGVGMKLREFREILRRGKADNALIRMLAGGLAALLVGSVLVGQGAALPASAAEGASILISKTVNEKKAVRDLRPGDSVTYRVEFLANDEDADGPAVVVDELPAAFAGWQVSDLVATFNSQRAGVSLDLPGITSGDSPALPLSGTLPTDPSQLKITVGVALPVQAGAGNTEGTGIPTGAQGVLEYTLTVPSDLDPSDPILRTDLTNTATFTAKAGEQSLSTSSSAIIEIDNPIAVDVTPAKSWTPSAQSFQPGATSTISIGATQASNVNASALRLQDPADPALAPDGAGSLPAANPFNFVDFAGFSTPADPTTNLPTGADSAEVEVYRFNGSTWNWEAWSSAIPNSEIAGVRIAYLSSNDGIVPRATVNQGFSVVQRATNLATGKSISEGWSAKNEVLATVEVPDQEPVAKRAEANFEVAPESIDVAAQKRFYALPSGAETTNLTGVTAGDSVGVVLRAKNSDAPLSTALDSLTIVEPGNGSNAEFLGANLQFAGFDNANLAAIWPTGATGATITWLHADGPTAVTVDAGDPLPAPPAGKTITGFTVSYQGSIAAGATAEVRYQIKTSADAGFVAPGKTVGPLRNSIDVTGTRQGLDDKSATARADLSLVAPRIDVSIDKRVGPGTVMPGQDVVVQLDTVVKTGGGRTKPTEIVVEDAWGGADTFWDAFDAKQILPPISRPVNNGDPATRADLSIYYRDAAGDWVATPFATNPDESDTINVPAGATGVRFVYTNTSGLSQTTYVKPNISFVARDTLRSDPGQTTATSFDRAELYKNVATAKGTGQLDDRVVTGTDDDNENVGVRGDEGGPAPGTGMWADKAWANDVLTSQSAATTSTVQRWASTEAGYATVQLQDPASPSASGAGTVFEAFNLTHVRPIKISGSAGDGTVDPRLRWDLVTDVQLFDGNAWVSITPVPGGNWMDSNGFKGYALTAEQQQSTVGVRLVLAENTAARAAAAAAGDLTAPKVGDGVSASADIRSFRLDWQLRDTARTADGSLKWVKEKNTSFNCAGAATGCVDNVFAATGIHTDGTSDTDTANDTIQLLDGTTNVDLVKQVQLIDAASGQPKGTPGDSVSMVVPNPGELAAQDYPRARYTLTATNSSTVPAGARGTMKLAKLRLTDTSGPVDVDIDASQFTGRNYADETSSPGNHFDTFNLTGVSYGPLPAYIDTAESTVELWIFNGTPLGEQRLFTLQQVLDSDPAFTALLPNVVGISTTFSSTDPERTGNKIVVGAEFVTHLDVQMRQTSRLTGEPIEGGDLVSRETVPNEAVARGWDAVVDPATQPTDVDNANVLLSQASVRVGLQKQVSVQHGSASDDTIYETDPAAPVNVILTATPNGSTAPLNTLRIEDDSESFWNRFEFVSFGSVVNPRDADTAGLQVKVDGEWVAYSTFSADPAADLAKIDGVAVDFSRAEGNGLFPQGASSWSASWGTAQLPFTVKLRAGVNVDWADDSEQNSASTHAQNEQYGEAADTAEGEVLFSEGTHSLRVVKRAPNDTGTHQVDPLVALPWQLVFTNTGSGYLPITSVTDELPASLSWDGEAVTFSATPGTSGTSGLTADPAQIGVELSDDGRSLVFTWPAGQRMGPGESMTIGLGLILQPLPTGQQATNSVVVQAGVPLDSCEQPRDFGQQPQTPAAANECSNTNFVQPRAGTVVGAVKTVSGEYVETLSEDLVHGALDVRTGTECQPGSYRPIGSDYTRNPCASYTAVGATDTWKLQHLNTGSNPLSRMVIVDMMPSIGDKMLAGGAARGSTFRPVLVGNDPTSIFRFSGLPSGAVVNIDVTTNSAACVGSTPGSSLWVSDPSCSDTATNPANEWIALDAYLGDIADIAGIRVDIDMTAAPLQPAGNVVLEFETVNRVVDASEEGLDATLEQFSTPQFAWNQNGVIAWDTSGNRVNLPSAPQRAGVTVKTAPLVVSKVVTGPGADNAPESFPVALECTVPSGVADPERVALDLGASALLTVPKNGSVTVPGLPIGADCTASEAGEVGAHGESGRSIETQPGVSPATDGLSAEIFIRERAGDETLLSLSNTYTLGGLIVEKSVLSADQFPVANDHLRAEYAFELVCDVKGMSDPVTRTFTLKAGEQHEESELPAGARCTLTETRDGGAKSTSITISGDETDGSSREEIVISEDGVHALVSNVFDGVPPNKLENTGAELAAVIAAALALLLAGASVLIVARRRSVRSNS